MDNTEQYLNCSVLSLLWNVKGIDVAFLWINPEKDFSFNRP
jgi:hypothetical protein